MKYCPGWPSNETNLGDLAIPSERNFAEVDRQRRRTALAKLLSLEAPVAEWEEMEEEIIRGAV